MKLLSKKTLLILAIIGSMVLIGDFVLYFGMGVISWKTFPDFVNAPPKVRFHF